MKKKPLFLFVFIVAFLFWLHVKYVKILDYREDKVEFPTKIEIVQNDICNGKQNDSLITLRATEVFKWGQRERIFRPYCQFTKTNKQIVTLLGRTGNGILAYFILRYNGEDYFAYNTQLNVYNEGLFRFGELSINDKDFLVEVDTSEKQMKINMDVTMNRKIYNQSDFFFKSPIDIVDLKIKGCFFCIENSNIIDSLILFEKDYLEAHKKIIPNPKERLNELVNKLNL